MDNYQLGSYVCVNCGTPIKCLVKQYSSGVLKLVNCDVCDNVADKYVECDDVIILIDIILFNQQAYRHLLFNTRLKNHWKLAFLIVIVKTSDEWLCFKTSKNPKCTALDSQENVISTIYIILCITILGELIFFSVLLIFFIKFWNVFFGKKDCLKNLSLLVKSIISSSFGYFLLLPSLIWSDFQREVHLLFIYTYTLLSHIQALTVVFKITRPLLAGILILATAANLYCTSYLKWWLNLS